MLELRPTSFQSRPGVQVGWLSSGVVATVYTWRDGLGGAMLTFLVLRTLYVATLQRSLVFLLRCMHEGLGGVQRAKIFSCMWLLAMAICESTYSAPAKNNSTLKRLLWKQQKAPIKLIQWKVSKKKTKRKFGQISRENFAQFGSHKCAFRRSENAIKKTKMLFFYEHGSRFAGFLPVPSQEMRWWQHIYIMIYRYTLWKWKKLYWNSILYNILKTCSTFW